MSLGIAPTAADGLWYALRIIKRTENWREWRALLELVPEDKREQAAAYLREQAKLLRGRENTGKEKRRG